MTAGARPGSIARRRTLGVLLVTVLVVLAVTAGRYDQLSGRFAAGTGGPTQATQGSGDTHHLQPVLARAVQQAVAAAGAAGVELRVTSGWRSPAEQQRLFDAAVKKYGSARAASHWVLPPNESAHVRGAAVDVGPRAGARWLERHGATWGLCRRYDNEWWHFELLVPAGSSTCPAREPYAGA